MEVVDPEVVVGLLAEPSRLRAFAALVLGAETLGEIAMAASITVPAAGKAVDRLAAGGLVSETPGERGTPSTYRVMDERFRATAQAKASSRAASTESMDDKVLDRFFSAGRLVSIPMQRAKRVVVLDHLSGRFEPGRVYPEQEVNFMLGVVHPDYAALRRYLVDEGFLERRDGFYWRTGGTFDVE